MDEKNKNKKNNKVPTFNLSWLYILIFIAFGYLLLKDDGTDSSVKASYTDFKSYIEKGYVKNIVVYSNSNSLEVYFIPDSAHYVFGEKYAEKLTKPMLTIGVGSMDNLQTFIDESEAKDLFKGEVEYKEKSHHYGYHYKCIPIYFTYCHLDFYDAKNERRRWWFRWRCLQRWQIKGQAIRKRAIWQNNI